MNYLSYVFNVGWATMTENEYKEIINILENYKPNRICELGAGQSTKIFEHYKDKYNCELYSIEHDNSYKHKDTILLSLIDEETSININGHFYESCNKYEGLEEWIKHQNKFDFILIDGPYGWGFREKYKYGRIQLLSFIILNKLADQSFVCVHDTNRQNMRRTLNEFERLLFVNKYSYNKNVITDYPELTIYKINKIK